MAMTLDQAWSAVQNCAREMNRLYRQVVFDELAIVSFGDNCPHTLSYQGPRRAAFDAGFVADSAALRAVVRSGGQQYSVGDFEFSHEGAGTAFEAFLVLGPEVCLVCNNTVKSMSAIAANPLWLAAQVPFVELAESFRFKPLILAPASACLACAA
jgi:hypothetical protein